MTMSQPRVAVLGLGIMGSRMAERLVRSGFPVTVYNRSPDKAAPLAAAGASVAATPRDAAKDADLVLSMVSNDQIARAVWLGDNGAVGAMKPGAIGIESSTISVGWVRELATAIAGRGGELLDAPVTGSRIHAGSGELTFLVGGSAAALERARPALAAMSKTIHHLGPSGRGALTKLINNFMCGVQVASTAQALTMIERSGLDVGKTIAVLSDGAPGSPLVKLMFARMAASDYTPNFFLELAMKDLRYAIQEGARFGLDVTTAAAAADVFDQAVAGGLGQQDFSAVVEPYRRAATAAGR
jgi:3-hydroxyisobutyrate dehydrogenase